MTAPVSRDTAGRWFYEQSVSEAERAQLAAASEVEGLDAEIALLRMRLRKLFAERPRDFALALRGLDVLRRLIVARYALSKADNQALAEMAPGIMAYLEARGGGGIPDDPDA